MPSINLSLTVLLIIAASLLVGCGVDAREANSSSTPYFAIARGEVDVEGGMAPIFAPQTGRLLTINAHLGQHVRPGDILATLEARPIRTTLALAQAEVTMARARQHAAHLKQRSATAWFEKLQAAQAADAASPQAVDEARIALAEQVAAERVATADVSAASQRAAVASQALADLTIRSPVAGELVQVRTSPWMRVAADSEVPIVTVLPDRPRVVRAQVDEEFANALHDGMHAEVVVRDAPETVIPAKAVRCSPWLRRTDAATNSDERVDAKVIDCEISLDAPTLRVGQRVVVRFLKGQS